MTNVKDTLSLLIDQLIEEALTEQSRHCLHQVLNILVELRSGDVSREDVARWIEDYVGDLPEPKEPNVMPEWSTIQ